jgi:hypothetical protein
MPSTATSAIADEVRAKTVLSDLIRSYVALSKVGSEWKGLCPFHAEKTASFVVNDKRGFYHCFGCGAHGDGIEWLVRQEGLSRSAAIEQLAKSVGITAKKGGGKLNRTETVTVRLDPKLNYLCELASRVQRRTKSSFIEWAVAESLNSVDISESNNGNSSFNSSLRQLASSLWQVDEADRVIILAITAPTLLTHEEQIIWRLVRENGYIWRGRYNAQNEWTWNLDEDSLIRDRLRENWEIFKAVAAGDESENALPKWSKRRTSAFDDDEPF